LKKQAEEGLLPEHWRVHSIPAFSDKAYTINLNSSIKAIDKSLIFKFPKGTLWKSRYSATTEAELRASLKVSDESEWQGDFQQNPVPPDGFLYQRRYDYIYEDDELPKDAKGVIYTDPNLAKKSKGDKTCIISYLYSAETDLFYVVDLCLKSFSSSNELLAKTLTFKTSRIRFVGMDGHVNQESIWTNNIRNFCRINNFPYPPVRYCRYKVDECSKNLQLAWNEGKVKIARSVAESKDGIGLLEQIYAFAGKKANKSDDAADAIICVNELIHEMRLVRQKSRRRSAVIIKESIF
jgi:hypothetical protein